MIRLISFLLLIVCLALTPECISLPNFCPEAASTEPRECAMEGYKSVIAPKAGASMHGKRKERFQLIQLKDLVSAGKTLQTNPAHGPAGSFFLPLTTTVLLI